MAAVVIFAPTRPGDSSLPQTRWIAERTILALQRASHTPVSVVDEHATRDGLEQALTSDAAGEIQGCALFTHGRDASLGTQRQTHGRVVDDALLGADSEPALDRDNITILCNRWVYALACHAGGTELARLAVQQGAQCFAGYESSVYVEWHADDIPEPLRASMEALVTSTTLLLASGCRDQSVLQSRAQVHADEILRWCEEQLEEADLENVDIASLAMTAQGLARVIVVAGE